MTKATPRTSFTRTKAARRNVYLTMVDTAEIDPAALLPSRHGTGLCYLYDEALTERQLGAIDRLGTGMSSYDVFARLPEVKLIAPTADNRYEYDLQDYWVGADADSDPFDPREFRLTALAMLITLSEDL